MLSERFFLFYNSIINNEFDGRITNEKIKLCARASSEPVSGILSKGFDQLFANGHAMQDEVLQDIIELGQNSDYAKDKGFADIKTKEEFWAKVPVSEYEDYRMYVERNMKKDNKQLTDLETEYYLLSTGYSDRGKCYIETHLGAWHVS